MPKANRTTTLSRGETAAFGPVRLMRRGVLTERRVTCSKPGCPCGHDPEARHGPYFSLTRAVRGRTKTRLINAEAAVVVRQQIEEGRMFRAEIEAYWQACERYADEELDDVRAAEAEKGGSRRRSSRRLRPRSRG
jgi:hypothetical protein